MTRKNILLTLGAIAALIIGLPAAALGYLHTEAGARFVEAQLASQTGGAITVEGLALHGFLDIRLSRLAMDGFEVEGLQLDWSPSRLLSRTAHVESLTVEKLTISPSTTPAAEKAAEVETAPFALPQLPELPVALDLEKLDVKTLIFAAPAFGLEGRYTLQGTARATRNLSDVQADIQASRLSGKGALSLTAAYGAAQNDININLDFKDEDGAPLAALTGYDGGALSVQLQAQGPVTGTALVLDVVLEKGPKAQARLQLGYDAALKVNGTLEIAPMGIGGAEIAAYVGEAVAADIELVLAPDGSMNAFMRTHFAAPNLSAKLVARAQGRVGGNVKINLDSSQMRLADLPPDIGPLDVQLRSVLDQARNVLVVDVLQVKASAADVSFKGTVPLDTPYATQMQGVVVLADLAALAAEVKGQARADISLRGTAPNAPLAVDVQATAKAATGDMPLMDMAAKLHGTVMPDGALDMATTLSLPSLTPLDPRLQGALTLTGQVQGLVGALGVNAALRTQNFAFEGAPISAVQADVQATQQGAGATGKVQVNVLAQGAPVQLATPFAYDGTQLALRGFNLAGPGVSGAGTVSYNLAKAEGQGRVDLTLADLSKLAAVAGMAAQGQGRIGIDLAGPDIAVAASLSQLGGADLGASIELAKANITTRLADPMGGLRGQVSAQNVVAGGTVITALDLDLAAGKAGPGFGMSVAVAAPVDLALKAAGDVALGDTTQITLSRLHGTLDGEAFALAAPTRIGFGPRGLALRETVLTVGAGQIAAAFTQEGGEEGAKVRGHLKLTGLDLTRQMPNGFPVALTGGVVMEGRAHNPTIQLDLTATAPIEALDEDLVITAKGGLVNGALQAQLALAGAGGDFASTVSGRAVANLRDGVFAVAENVPLAVKAEGAIRLAPFTFLLFDDGSTLRGALRLSADAVLAGGPQRLTGSLCLQNFAAGLVASGTSLKGGAGCFTLTPDGAVAGEITATDGHSGKLALGLSAGPGSLLLSGLTADKAPLLQGRVQLDHLRVIDGDMGLVKVSGVVTGQAALLAALDGKLAGTLTVEQGDLVIPANAGPSFTPLTVRHVGRPQDQAAAEEATTAPQFGAGLALDIKVNVPRQFFVRGRGVESEWKGDVAVQGTLATPIIGGKISMIKGQATTGAAVLAFNRGVVTLVPDPPALMPIVLIDMVSEANVDGTTARMTLAGPVTQPKISFSSDPPLPEDEILARLLFGKPAAQMTASEALSMAGAALELSGTFGGGVGVLGQVRRSLGVDRLSVDASADAPGSSSVSAGKYITPEVYMSVRQAADGTAPDIAVEYEVTDEITITGEQEGTGGESVGVRYEYDY